MGGLLKIKGFLPYISVVFLNAFVDLGHKITIQNTIFKTYSGDYQVFLTAIVNALILLPFILLFTPCGFLSDKYPKNRLMQVSAVAAVILTILITVFYYLGWFWSAFAMTFLLAVQSAFYSPAKYGYIKEIVGKNKLATANGAVQATTMIAILAGTFVFSILFELYLKGAGFGSEKEVLLAIAPLGWFLIVGAVIELILTLRLPKTQETDNSMQFDWRQYGSGRYLANNLATVKSHEIIFLSIIGLSLFWAIGQVMLAAFPAFAKESMGLTDVQVVQGMLACAGIGIMLGSLIAGKLSRNHIETGLIPVGSIGVALCLFILPKLGSVPAHSINILMLGMLGGMFIIPLNALIQFHAGEQTRGRVLAGSNLIQNTVMLGFLGITVALSEMQQSRHLFTLLTLVAIGGATYTLCKLPQSLVRLLVTFAIGRRYHLEIIGFKNMPESGGVLMLGNHISWIDWAIVQMASPRPIRFVMAKSIYQKWYLRWFLDRFGVVPISAGAGKGALEKVTRLLNNGEVVCLFPEGGISRSGQLAEFKSGYEYAAGAGGVILPFYIHGLWGTRFSRSSDKLKSIRSDNTKHNIIMTFGETLPMQTRADELKRRIFDLSISSWQRYTDSLQALPHAFLDTVKRTPRAPAVADSMGETWSYKKLAVACVCFASLIKQHSREQNVGLLLPTSSAGIMATMATLLAGKTAVHLNYTADPEALQSAIEKASIKSVYTSSRFLKKLEQKGMDLSGPLAGVEKIYCLEDLREQISHVKKLLTLILLSVLPAALLKRLYSANPVLDAPAVILFSSGSEGVPKGIMLSHRNIMTNLKQVSDVLNIGSDDAVTATLPLFHAFGLTITTFLPLIEGIPTVCYPDPTDAVSIGKTVARYNTTILCGTSTFLRLYTKNQRLHPLMFESLRIVVSGAEKLGTDVHEAFKLKFHKDICEGYGVTETAPAASVNIPNHLDTHYWRVQTGNKPGTVGMPLPGTSFRIVDPDTLEQLPTDSDGLILISGAQVMLGYLDDPEKTANAIVELDGQRWYKTGDKGHLDKDGFLTIVDRYSRFAKLGGEMISLTAVEGRIRSILEKPEIELVAINLPDSKKGERIEVLTDDDIDYDALKKALLDADTSPMMIPDAVHRVEAVPKLGSGKTDFSTARKLLLQITGG
ncbi:MAG: acyl-[ACP]--phospholipid O-acyltransferase [Gammaproteobacteria bacterium]